VEKASGNIHGLPLSFLFQMVSKNPPAVFIFVAINTKVLPVRAIRWVVAAIPVFMVHSKKIPVFGFKLSPAFSAEQPVYFQGLFPVI
jgi:hypothetical protein